MVIINWDGVYNNLGIYMYFNNMGKGGILFGSYIICVKS